VGIHVETVMRSRVSGSASFLAVALSFAARSRREERLFAMRAKLLKTVLQRPMLTEFPSKVPQAHGDRNDCRVVLCHF
jgi:hypothetical protein